MRIDSKELSLMEDFSFKLQDIKEKNWFKICVKIFLLIIAIAFFFILIIFLFKTLTKNEDIELLSVPLIKSEVQEIKRLPQKLDDDKDSYINIYNIVDNKDNDKSDLIIKKIEEKNIISQNFDNDFDIMSDQKLLMEKIEEMSDIEDIIVKKNEITVVNTNKNKIDINKNKIKNNKDTIKKLNNGALIRNLKEKKDIKPGVFVQLLALKNRDSVVLFWNTLKKKYPNLFDGKNYFIIKTDMKEIGEIYKLQIGSFNNRNEAENFCKEYIKNTNKSKVECIIIKN
jgi:hypothetical protein